jgi:hypothetical protein
MAKKQFFAIIDTETTINDTVADFACIIVDRQGNIHNQCAVLVANHYDTMSLFYDKNATGLWSKDYANKKRDNYEKMINNGTRMLASVNAINRWINQAIGKYNPTVTAYNMAFDYAKCTNTGIDLSVFNNRFCLWQASIGNICNKKAFKQFALDNHQFNKPTANGNMTFKTTAETVCGFINNEMIIEPHTALEDARDFELPILVNILKKKNWKDNIKSYDWKDFQVKDHFEAR